MQHQIKRIVFDCPDAEHRAAIIDKAKSIDPDYDPVSDISSVTVIRCRINTWQTLHETFSDIAFHDFDGPTPARQKQMRRQENKKAQERKNNEQKKPRETFSNATAHNSNRPSRKKQRDEKKKPKGRENNGYRNRRR